MVWSEIEPGQWSSDSGLLLENRPGVGPYIYSEELEDEIPDSGMPLVDLFKNPLLSVVTVDPDTGKLPVSLMPSIAITDLFIVNSQAAMLSLSAQRGDIAVRTDIPGPGMFILSGDDPTFLPNWIPITAQFPDWNHIQNKPASFPPTSHDHDSRYYTKSETDNALLQNGIYLFRFHRRTLHRTRNTGLLRTRRKIFGIILRLPLTGIRYQTNPWRFHLLHTITILVTIQNPNPITHYYKNGILEL